jgi:TctA family transporter
MKIKVITFVVAMAAGFMLMGVVTARGATKPTTTISSIPGDKSVIVEGTTPDGYPYTYGGNAEQARQLADIGEPLTISR